MRVNANDNGIRRGLGLGLLPLGLGPGLCLCLGPLGPERAINLVAVVTFFYEASSAQVKMLLLLVVAAAVASVAVVVGFYLVHGSANTLLSFVRKRDQAHIAHTRL